jgi:hypothetical protein
MMKTKKLAMASLAALALIGAACGGDDSSSGSAGGDQGKVADQMMSAAKDEGIELDRECVDTVAGKLSDADAKAILASIDSDEDPEISADGDALAEEMFSCVPADAIVQQMMDSIGDQPGMDKECVQKVLEGLSSADMASLAQSDGDMSNPVMSQIMEGVLPCMSLGG